jgi:hypothetical protein
LTRFLLSGHLQLRITPERTGGLGDLHHGDQS